MNSVIELNRKQCPIREVLWWTLHPLQLSYIVKDGVLMIDSPSSMTRNPGLGVERKLDRLLESLDDLSEPGK